MNHLHDRGLDRLIDDINSFPERNVNMTEEEHAKRALDMATKATEAAKRVIESAISNPLQRGIAMKATGPIFETAMLAIVSLRMTGVPLKDAQAITLLALDAAREMIRTADLNVPE